jgi:hypothetical protein
MQTFAQDAAIILALLALWAVYVAVQCWQNRRAVDVPPIRECKLHYCPDCEQTYTCPADACRMPYLCRHADVGMECAPVGAAISVPVAGG